MKLTKRIIDDIGPKDKTFFVWDTALTGFGVRVGTSGRKIFILQTRLRGRTKRYSIGRYGQPWAVDQARAEAMRLLGLTSQGVDPKAGAGASKHMTVAELCERYFADACHHKKPQTISDDQARAKRHIVPLLGSKPVGEITKPTVQRFIADIASGKTAVDERTGSRGRAIVTGGKGAANRTHALLSAMLSYAVDLGLRDDNPARGVKHYKLRKRERYLHLNELENLGQALEAASREGRNLFAVSAIRFLLLTGWRKNEALTLEWKWIDFERGLVALPDTKAGAKTLQVSAAAMQFLQGLPRISGTRFVFPSSTSDGPLVGLFKTWNAIRKQAGIDEVRIHDLRHSFASQAVSMGQSLYVVGKLLGHTQASTTQRYAHLANDPVKSAADDVASEISRQLAKGVK